MKFKYLILLISAVIFSGCNLLSNQQPAALKISTNPKATVFIDGKEFGSTPFTNQELQAGEITLKLVPDDPTGKAQAWESLLELTSGVITVVNYDFATEINAAAGEQLTLQPTSQSVASLSIISIPDAAVVRVDNESKGFTPLSIDEINEGDHQVLIASPGYKDRTINVKTQKGFKLTISAQLAKDGQPELPPVPNSNNQATPSAESSPSAEVTKSPSKLTPTPTTRATTKSTPTPTAKPTGKTTPTPTKKAAATTPEKPYVKVNDTPTGWLRVRSEPSVSGEEVAKVNPGETYSLKDSQSGWLQIEYEDGKLGWIAGQYAEKYE